jgi:hypothetical protein
VLRGYHTIRPKQIGANFDALLQEALCHIVLEHEAVVIAQLQQSQTHLVRLGETILLQQLFGLLQEMSRVIVVADVEASLTFGLAKLSTYFGVCSSQAQHVTFWLLQLKLHELSEMVQGLGWVIKLEVNLGKLRVDGHLRNLS